jgi:hypothetical protein
VARGVAYFFSVVVVVVVDVDAPAGGGGAVVVVVVDEVIVVGSAGLSSEFPPPHAMPTADTAARTIRPIILVMIVASMDRFVDLTCGVRQAKARGRAACGRGKEYSF